MGGGGFTMEPDNPVLDDFVLALAGAREPRILFLPTASGDPTAQITAFHARFGDRACRADAPVAVPPARLDAHRCATIVLEQDVIYIGGGSMRNLLAIWRAHGLDELLVEAWERGHRARRPQRRRDVLVRGRHHALERAAGDDRGPRAAARAR